MKNFIYFYVGFILLAMNTLNAQYVTLEDKQFWLGLEKFYPLAVNYSLVVIHDADSNKYYVSPSHSYDTTNSFECFGEACADSVLQRDFNYIAGMGFNSIRFYGFYPKYRASDSTFVFMMQVPDLSKYDSIFITPGAAGDTTMQIILPLYDQILKCANNTVNNITNEPAPLKVIFNITGNKSSYYDDEVTAFDNYLNVLSSHLDTTENNEAMFAYDLMNEPCYHVTVTKTKEEACDMISTWYNTIKTNDKKHLVTIGSCGVGDVFSFDPSILKVDFYSLHYYPGWKEAYEDRRDISIQERAWARTVNDIFWMENNTNRPWIVGEVGLSASKNYSIDTGGMNGTLANQAAFAIQSLNAVRDCGGSGYSWAGYQDVSFAGSGSSGFHANFYGLIERNHSPGPWSEKPAVDTFRYWNYIKDTCPVCYSSTYDTAKLYYNPYRHPTFDSIGGSFMKYGYVMDQDDNSIPDVYFGAHNWIRGRNDPRIPDSVSAQYTYSDQNGFYQIIPYDYVGVLNDSAYVYLMNVCAAGSDILHTDIWSQSWPANNSTITLNKIDYSYSGSVNNLTISSGTDSIFDGHYRLTVEDVTIENNATASFYATNKVHIKPGFTASAGSSTSIYCADTAIVCSDYNWDAEWKNSVVVASSRATKKDIAVQFILVDYSEVLSVHPNPTRGVVNVLLNNPSEEMTYQIILMDIFGSVIIQKHLNTNNVQLDLSPYPKGIYLLKYSNQEENLIKKILKQ